MVRHVWPGFGRVSYSVLGAIDVTRFIDSASLRKGQLSLEGGGRRQRTDTFLPRLGPFAPPPAIVGEARLVSLVAGCPLHQ